MRRFLIVYGTRPELIKIAPIYWEITRLGYQRGVACDLLNTGQHPDLVPPLEEQLAIRPKFTLARFARDGSQLDQLTSGVIEQVGQVLKTNGNYDGVVVQGDTSSAFAAALAAFHAKKPVIHIEAGLRTTSPTEPFPEEMNRRMITKLASWHCAPTELAYDTLISEGVPAERVHLTGNTIVDATLKLAPETRSVEKSFDILITMHRRENWGRPMNEALIQLVEYCQKRNLTARFVLHANPQLQDEVRRLLSNQTRIQVIPPQEYVSMLSLIRECTFIASDSGGIQEEAVTLRKPVVVLRQETERPEAVQAGWARLCEPNFKGLSDQLDWALTINDGVERAANPFGDGHAGEKILSTLCLVDGQSW